MSVTKKVVISYAKSLFQNVNTSKASEGVFEVSKITSEETNTFIKDLKRSHIR